MIGDVLKFQNADETDIVSDSINNHRPYKTARRRSLSGSAVPSKTVNRRVNFGLITDKLKLKHSNHRKDYDSTDTILSELGSMDKSTDSMSSSSGINVSETFRKSIASDNTQIHGLNHRRKCHSVSTKMRIKHFLSEHIVRTHPCNHPEYHFNRKDSENTISVYDSKSTNFNESDFQEYSPPDSSEASSIKDESVSRPKSEQEVNMTHNSINMASTILDRIRNINIHSLKLNQKNDDNGFHDIDHVMPKESERHSSISTDSQNDCPFPEPNPCKLPRVTSPTSIDFSSKQILQNKRQRLAHSISYDPDYVLVDNGKACNMKRLSYAMSMCPEFIPEKDKWERKISGYLDTSTPTGATLTAINFGLKRVTETDKYLMITKSPTSCPNEFLEDGISHVEETSEIYQSLLRHSSCYDVMPDSGKVIIIDSQMQIGRAFEAIEDNIVRASPIWSSEKQSFIALLTVNDLIPLLLHLHQQRNSDDHCCESDGIVDIDFSTVTVEKCLSVIPRFRSLQSHIIGVPPETNLHAVTVMLNRFHRTMVLVLDSFLSGNPLFLLTCLRTLTYLFYKAHTVSLESCFATDVSSSSMLTDQLFEYLRPLSDAESPCQSLCIQTPGKPQYLITFSSSIVDVLRAMARSYYCCALISNREPVDGKFVVDDVITMADILNLVKIERHRDSSVTAADILQYRCQYHESMSYRDPVIRCNASDSVHHVINIIVKEKASFVLVQSIERRRNITIGIVTAHDILVYIDSLPYNATELHNGCSIGKLEKSKRNHIEESELRLRSQSDVYCALKHKPLSFEN